MCVVEKAGFEARTLGTGAERAANCTTRPGRVPIKVCRNDRHVGVKRQLVDSEADAAGARNAPASLSQAEAGGPLGPGDSERWR